MRRIISILLAAAMLLCISACSGGEPAQEAVEPEIWTVPDEMRNDPFRYRHGPEGYYNLIDEGVDFTGGTQKSGTCWLYASVASMETAYSIKNGKPINVDPMALFDRIYEKDRKEGYYVGKGASPMSYGGIPWMVVETISNGCGDIAVDEAMIIYGQDRDTFKQIIKERGGVAVGTCDTSNSGKAVFGHYTTKNYPGVLDYDHEEMLIGWDDHFPKEFFKVPATQDGAWITYNSQNGKSCFDYISYDSDFEPGGSYWLSVTDKYSDVIGYDCGHLANRQIMAKNGPVTLANVFRRKGTLAAVGTYSDTKQQEIRIDVYDANFDKLLYTQEATLGHMGYHTVELDTPLKVEDCAVAVTYSKSAPVEGVNHVNDKLIFRAVAEPGQSFACLPGTGEWKDMTDDDIREALGISFKPNNCCIKALYTDD